MSEAVEKGKRPASQYYWGDWWKDKGLHSCSLPARGLWHEMNCLMHEGEPYGHLTLNGRPMTTAQLANQCRITAPVCTRLIQELENAGVFSRADTGAIFSRRMVRDEAIRNARAAGGKAGAEHGIKGAEGGKKGGRPATKKGGFETPLDPSQKPPPSSSSSSSSSVPPTGVEGGKPPKPPASFELPDWMPAKPWEEFVEMRRAKGKRAPFTVAAAKGIVDDLGRMRTDGQDVAAVLRQSVVNGWSGVFPLKADKVGGAAPRQDWTGSAE